VLKSGNVCYHSVQNLLSSSLLYKNKEIGICRATILSVVLYGCETWSLTFREGRRLCLLENRVLRRIFGPKMVKVIGEWINYVIRSIMIYTPYQILFGSSI
jgi:hypothetical protein